MSHGPKPPTSLFPSVKVGVRGCCADPHKHTEGLEVVFFSPENLTPGCILLFCSQHQALFTLSRLGVDHQDSALLSRLPPGARSGGACLRKTWYLRRLLYFPPLISEDWGESCFNLSLASQQTV